MKRNWFKKIIGGLSLTSALFVFQACYGTPQDFEFDLFVQGQVKSEESGLPIPGIKVTASDYMQYELTDENGNFSFYTRLLDSITFNFEDIDSTQNGHYVSKDTIVSNFSGPIFLDINLETK